MAGLGEGEAEEGKTHQATESVLAAEIGLGPRGALADLRDDVGAVGRRWASVDAEDEPVRLDKGGVEVWGVQGDELEDALGGWQGGLQFAIITAVGKESEGLAWTSIKWSRVLLGIHTSTWSRGSSPRRKALLIGHSQLGRACSRRSRCTKEFLVVKSRLVTVFRDILPAIGRRRRLHKAGDLQLMPIQPRMRP